MRARIILFFLGGLIGQTSLLQAQQTNNIALEKFLTLHIGVGQSYYTFIDNNDEILASHNDKWRSAFNFHGQLGFHPNERWMFSIMGSMLRSEGRTDGLQSVSRTGVVYHGYLEDKVQLFVAGINAERRIADLKLFRFSYHLGINLFYLENRGRFIVDDFKLSGTDLGFHLGLNGEYKLSDKLSLVAQFQYMLNVVGNPTYQVVDQKIPVFISNQDMSHIELNVGIRYSLLREVDKKTTVPQQDDYYVPSRRFE